MDSSVTTAASPTAGGGGEGGVMLFPASQTSDGVVWAPVTDIDFLQISERRLDEPEKCVLLVRRMQEVAYWSAKHEAGRYMSFRMVLFFFLLDTMTCRTVRCDVAVSARSNSHSSRIPQSGTR